MNYIKPENIKAYVDERPEGMADTSEELAAMVNHFIKSSVFECIDICENTRYDGQVAANRIRFVFGLDNKDR